MVTLRRTREERKLCEGAVGNASTDDGRGRTYRLERNNNSKTDRNGGWGNDQRKRDFEEIYTQVRNSL